MISGIRAHRDARAHTSVNVPSRRSRLTSLSCLLIWLAACGGAAPEEPAAEPAIEIPALAVYVTNENSGDLTIIDAGKNTAIATIPLGKRPRGISVSPDRKFLYVALSGSPAAIRTCWKRIGARE